jgi:hypothetical protein
LLQDVPMINVSKTITLNATADAIWRVIGDFSAACDYLSMVVQCRVEGEGIGALRTLTGADGSTIIERLDAMDPTTHQLSYALLTDTPFRNCLTTVILRDLGLNLTEIGWSATFEADGIPSSEAAELMEGALATNCLALKEFME